MPIRSRIVLIHATRVAMSPIEEAFARLWPEVEVVSLLDEGLSADSASGHVSADALDARIGALADYARGMSPAAILYTCSSFGRGIEKAALAQDIPVLKPNEAMFDAAIASGGNVVMLYSFPPAKAAMEAEFNAAVQADGSAASLRSVFVPDALDALKAGDRATHDRLVAEAARAVGPVDAILLAHFSMAPAAEAVRAVTDIPVLTSPETAIDRLKSCLNENTPC